MSELDWRKAQKLPWRQRNLEVENAVRSFLSRQAAGKVFSTEELAFELWPSWRPSWHHKEVAKLSQLLSRMAKHLTPLATHDGEEIKRYGQTRRRWQWHGQKG